MNPTRETREENNMLIERSKVLAAIRSFGLDPDDTMRVTIGSDFIEAVVFERDEQGRCILERPDGGYRKVVRHIGYTDQVIRLDPKDEK